MLWRTIHFTSDPQVTHHSHSLLVTCASPYVSFLCSGFFVVSVSLNCAVRAVYSNCSLLFFKEKKDENFGFQFRIWKSCKKMKKVQESVAEAPKHSALQIIQIIFNIINHILIITVSIYMTWFTYNSVKYAVDKQLKIWHAYLCTIGVSITVRTPKSFHNMLI